MGIDKESDRPANLQVGPTTLGLVRLYVESEGIELPLDFEPHEAEEIAQELMAAAARAREIVGGSKSGSGKDAGGKGSAPGAGDRPGGGQPGRSAPKRRRGSGSSR